MSDPLTPEERAFWKKRVGLPGEGLMARDFRRLLDQVASLTAERDQACANAAQAMHAARVIEASALARLEKAREALAVWLRPAPHPDAPYDEYEAWQAEEQKALDAMTSALGEP